MDVIRLNYNQELKFEKNVVAAMGQFDGLHRGHVSLINKAIEVGKEQGLKVAVVTFDPHPDFVLKKRANFGYITPLPKKLELLESIGLDYVILLHFDEELSKLEPNLFHERFLSSFSTIVVGTDYRYGYRGKGSIETLRQTGKNVIAVELIKTNDEKIGSNLIREYLMDGKVDLIYDLMGRYYNISGVVSHGSKIGRTFGVRTANIELTEEYQMIKKGVYVVYVHIDGKVYLGACNIGTNPTVNTVDKMRLEVHILDFENDIYGKEISIDVIYRIRDELRFDSIDKLVKQIEDDITFTKTNFGDKI